MPNLEACIFDLDGVIVDTAKYHFLAWKRLADELGIPFTEDDNEQLKGVSRMDSLDIILGLGNYEASSEEKEKMATRKNEWYKESIHTMDAGELLPGTLDFLNHLRSENISVGLGSSSKNAGTILDLVNIQELFDAVADGNHITKAKPDPQIFLLSAEMMGVSPENCVVFEDAVAGIEAAIAGGMHTVGIGSADILTEAEIVAASLAEVDLERVRGLF